jgi:arylsulfatase
MLVSDNGAEGGSTAPPTSGSSSITRRRRWRRAWTRSTSSAGRTRSHHYPRGWTWAGNMPLRRWRREPAGAGPATRSWSTGRPGSRPVVRCGPSTRVRTQYARADPVRACGPSTRVRTQYAHLIDIVPTVLDALGVDPPATIRGVTQSPIHGVSFVRSFADASAPSRRQTQYSGPGREPQPGRPAHRDDRRVVRRGGQVKVLPIDSSAAARLMVGRPQVAVTGASSARTRRRCRSG